MPARPARDEKRLTQQRVMGRRIRWAREDQGLSRLEVAKRLGFTGSWLQGVETGVNGIDAIDLKRLAELLGYSLEYFADPNFETRLPRPQNRNDWQSLYPERPELAKLHWELDRNLNGGGPTPFRQSGPRSSAA